MLLSLTLLLLRYVHHNQKLYSCSWVQESFSSILAIDVRGRFNSIPLHHWFIVWVSIHALFALVWYNCISVAIACNQCWTCLFSDLLLTTRVWAMLRSWRQAVALAPISLTMKTALSSLNPFAFSKVLIETLPKVDVITLESQEGMEWQLAKTLLMPQLQVTLTSLQKLTLMRSLWLGCCRWCWRRGEFHVC